MKRTTIAVVTTLALMTAFGGAVYYWLSDTSTQYLHNRPWLTKLTESPKENTHVLYVSDEVPYGATVHGSQYRHLVNMISHKLDGDVLQVKALQTGRQARFGVKTWECDEAPGDLDLCMDLTVKRGKRDAQRSRTIRMYSAKAWDQESDVPTGPATVSVASVPEEVVEIDTADAQGELDWLVTIPE